PADTMKLAVQPGRTTYRPGEEAAVSFTVRSSDGEPLEAALGVAVVDAAVGARVRSDATIARSSRLPAPPVALPAIPREDLEHIDFTRPIPADLDLLAEVLLAAPQPGVRVDRSP